MLSTPAWSEELLVSAAASLTNAFQDIKPLFEKTHPDTTLVLNFASSGALYKQMEQGAPVDVFASADQETMDKAKNLLEPGSRINFAGNALVLVVPASDPEKITSVQDLQNPQVKLIAIGNPDSVPAGRYARTCLEAENLYTQLTPRFVLAETVRQALDYVARGEVQAGIVFATDAASRAKQVRVATTLEGHAPITYPIALLARSSAKDAGKRFLDFLCGQEGQRILAKHGFTAP